MKSPPKTLIPDNSMPGAATRMESCPACHNTGFKTKRLIGSISVKACIACGFLINEFERSEPREPEFSRINERAYHRAIGELRKHQALEVLRFVKARAGDSKNWLDVGCGFGYLLMEARVAGYRVSGIEPDKIAFAQACALLGDGVVQYGLMDERSVPDNSRDIISVLDVLEHIAPDELSKFASIIHRKLRSGGLWVIKVPSTDGLYFRLAHALLLLSPSIGSGFIRRLWQTDYEYPHCVYFREDTIKLFLQNNGFEVVALKYLEEVPSKTVVSRLSMDDTIPKWQAWLYAPALICINLIEKVRRRSDALLVLARKKRQRLLGSEWTANIGPEKSSAR